MQYTCTPGRPSRIWLSSSKVRGSICASPSTQCRPSRSSPSAAVALFGEHAVGFGQHRLLLVHPPYCQKPRRAKPAIASSASVQPNQSVFARVTPSFPRGAIMRPNPLRAGHAMSDSVKTLVIVAFLVVILWNLGAGLYYMLVDKGTTKRTVNALTKRIALSVALILFVILAIYMGGSRRTTSAAHRPTEPVERRRPHGPASRPVLRNACLRAYST
jgi:hypothetical protein